MTYITLLSTMLKMYVNVKNLICESKIYRFIIKNEAYFCGIFFVFVILILHLVGIGCPTRFLTGVSCPGCGMTRAVIHTLKCDFKGALYYHPLVFTLPLIAFLYLRRNRINKIVLNSLLFVIILAFFGVYVARLLDFKNEVVYVDIGRSFIFKILKNFHI